MKGQKKVIIIIIALVVLAVLAFFVLKPKPKSTSNSAKFERSKSAPKESEIKSKVQYLTKEEYIKKYMPDIANNSLLFNSAMNGTITSHNENIVIV